MPIDIGLLNIHSEEGVVHKYFLNGCGLGFDAFVVKMTNFMKQRLGGGAWVYHLSIFLSVFGYGSKKMRITDHEKSIDTNIFTIAIGNGCYSGGGLKQTPKAKPNDGIFHITAIQRPDLWRIIKGLNQLFNDKLDEHPLAYNFITHQFTIESNETFLCETDGVLQPIANKYDVEIIPNALQMLI